MIYKNPMYFMFTLIHTPLYICIYFSSLIFLCRKYLIEQ